MEPVDLPNLLVATFPPLHFQNRSIRIRFLLCTKAPNVWCNTATHSLAACEVSGVAVPLFSTLIWIANFLKGRNWKAAECPANPDSRRGMRLGAGQSSQLVGENMKYWHARTQRERLGQEGESRTQTTHTVHIHNTEGTRRLTYRTYHMCNENTHTVLDVEMEGWWNTG